MNNTETQTRATEEISPMEDYAREILEIFNATKDYRSKCEIDEAIEDLFSLMRRATEAGIGKGEPRYWHPTNVVSGKMHGGARLHGALEVLQTNLQWIIEGDEDDGAMACENLFTYEGRRWLLERLAEYSPWIAVAHRRSLGEDVQGLPLIAAFGEDVPLNNHLWTEFWFANTDEYGTTENVGLIKVDTVHWPQLAFDIIQDCDFMRYAFALEMSKFTHPTIEDIHSICEKLGIE